VRSAERTGGESENFIENGINGQCQCSADAVNGITGRTEAQYHRLRSRTEVKHWRKIGYCLRAELALGLGLERGNQPSPFIAHLPKPVNTFSAPRGIFFRPGPFSPFLYSAALLIARHFSLPFSTISIAIGKTHRKRSYMKQNEFRGIKIKNKNLQKKNLKEILRPLISEEQA